MRHFQQEARLLREHALSLITRALLGATLLTQNVESPLYNYLYLIPLPHAFPQARYAYDRSTQCDL